MTSMQCLTCNFDQYGRSQNIDFFFQVLDTGNLLDVFPNT